MEKVKTDESRAKAREQLKKLGKDPDKLMPKTSPAKPETQSAGSESLPENKKAVETQVTEKEQKEIESRAALEAESKKKADEENRLLEAKEEELSPEDKTKKKELLTLKETEKEAQKEAKLQKRFDDLIGEIKSLRSEKSQDQERINKLESELKQTKSAIERNPEKNQQEVTRLESERIRKYADEDKELPREKRREMTKAELEEWLVEDIVSANEWLAERQIRRREERADDLKKIGKTATDDDANTEANRIIKKQAESSARAAEKHPELKMDFKKRAAELKAQGMDEKQVQETLWKENPKARIVAEILKENPDKYMLSENGPELLAEEMEKRMNSKKTETDDERDERLRQEGAERERQRLEQINPGLTSTRSSVRSTEKAKDPLYQKQWDIFRKSFPHETDAQITARLDKRLKARA